jgi:hypothetical protein
MTLEQRIEARIVELNRLVANHEAHARHFQMLGQTHRVQEHNAIALAYAQSRLELVRLVAGGSEARV